MNLSEIMTKCATLQFTKAPSPYVRTCYKSQNPHPSEANVIYGWPLIICENFEIYFHLRNALLTLQMFLIIVIVL